MRAHFLRSYRTYSAERDKLVLPGVDVLVIGPVPPHVSRTVDQPGGVEHQGVPQQGRDVERHPQGLPPQVPRHEHGDEEAHEQHGHLVMPVEEAEWTESRGAHLLTWYENRNNKLSVIIQGFISVIIIV